MEEDFPLVFGRDPGTSLETENLVVDEHKSQPLPEVAQMVAAMALALR